MIGARQPKVTAEMVRRVMDAPPDFIEKSYLPAWRAGRISTTALACGVVAALGRSAYDDSTVDVVVMNILVNMGYADEPVSALWA